MAFSVAPVRPKCAKFIAQRHHSCSSQALLLLVLAAAPDMADADHDGGIYQNVEAASAACQAAWESFDPDDLHWWATNACD